VLAVSALLVTPIVFTFGNGIPSSGSKFLAASTSSPYSENLSLYLTSSETFWRVDLFGGNITISSVSPPSSVSGYSITLTHYTTWKSQFEIFTKYGYGLLGSGEPYPDGAVLVANTTSQSDASQLANSLNQRFGLAFEQVASSSGSFTFFSPISYTTEIHVYFFPIIPQSAKGFATMFTETQLESNDLDYFKVSYSASSSGYSLSYGGLSALSSATFSLYTQLGLIQSAYNYSSVATSSTIQVHVLGGLVSTSNTTFVNNFSNLSASFSTLAAAGNHSNSVPNINATLDFSFPTILAYRQITPTLTPSHNANVSVTIYVRNVSPTSAPTANNVQFNDSWIYSNKNDFNLTVGQTGKVANLTSGATETVAYAFTVVGSSGTIHVPATPVTYQFSSAGNKTVTATAYLNPETIIIGGSNTPLLEATESLPSGTIQAGQTFSVNVSIANKGSGPAINLVSGTLKKANLPVGSTWSFLSNASTGGLTSTNSTVSYPVSWFDAGGVAHNTTTNTMSAVFSFSSPGTPAMYLEKSVQLSNTSKSANVTLVVFNGSPNELSNVSIKDSVPTGLAFWKSFNTSSLHSNAGSVNVNISSLKGSSNESFGYSVNVTAQDQNFIFPPANISASWNDETIVHYSGGYGLPLGVRAIKIISPSQGFQGTNVTVSLRVVNNGSLPVYDASLGSVTDTFLHVTTTQNSTLQAVLGTGQTLSESLNGYLTGTQGTYDSSSAVASFLFAGTNQTASTSSFNVTVYALPTVNLTFSGLKIEEDHNIDVTETIENPSNVVIDNVTFRIAVPKGLTIESGQSPNFTIPSIAANSNTTHQFTIITNQPNTYEFGKGNLTFYYQGHIVLGNTSATIVNITDDITLRYGIPIIIGLVIVIGTILYVRRLTPKQ